MSANALPDHRMKYLEYEGPLSGDRGQVTLWDSGSYELEQQNEQQFTVRLRGNRVPAWATFSRSDNSTSDWRIEFRSDARTANE